MVYPQLGFHTVRGYIVQEDNRLRLRLIGVVDITKAFCSEDGIVYSPGASGFTNPTSSAIIQWGWGLRAVRGGIDPGDDRCRPRFVRVVDELKDF